LTLHSLKVLRTALSIEYPIRNNSERSVAYRASRCFVARYFCRVFATRSLSSQSTTLLRTILSNLFLPSLHYVLQKYIKRLARNRAGLSFCFCYPLRSEERSYDNISCRPTWYSLNGGPSCGRTADFRSGGLQALRSATDWPKSINELPPTDLNNFIVVYIRFGDCRLLHDCTIKTQPDNGSTPHVRPYSYGVFFNTLCTNHTDFCSRPLSTYKRGYRSKTK
jgi:hypothetical protein